MLMEHTVRNSDGVEIRKKSRSLDLQSIYKSRMSKEVLSKILKRKRRLDGANGNGESVKKKRKSRKEVNLSTLENSRKSGDQVYSDGAVSLGEKDLSKTSKLVNGISLSLNDSDVKIPRRRRGFVGRRKEVNHFSNLAGSVLPSCNVVGNVDEASKLFCDSSRTVDFEGRKRKKCSTNVKENKASDLNSESHVKREDDVAIIGSVDTSSVKKHKDRRKKKSLRVESSTTKEATPSVNDHKDICDDPHDDDEENLEQNAARMLSSRFDPNCTGFSTNRNDRVSTSGDELSFLNHGQDFIGLGVKSSGGPESPSSLDNAAMILRPRKQRKQKGLTRKRRHFYELLSKDLDALFVVNRRIKVFWPLDQSWYFGLVKDYDSERKLHHVKYDDRDEEWIDLENERFKLLMLPSEVPGKADRRKRASRSKHSNKGKEGLEVKDDRFLNSFMDSEPIISWLARSSRRVKSAPLDVSKKQKASCKSSTFAPSVSRKLVDPNECVDAGPSNRDATKSCSSHTLSESFANVYCPEKFEVSKSLCSRVEKLPRVYYRKRYHKRGEQSCPLSQDDSIHRNASGTVNDRIDDLDDGIWDVKEVDACCQIDTGMPYWTTDGAGLLVLIIPMTGLRQFKFELTFPVLTLLNSPFGIDCRLIKASLLLQSGALISIWPIVHLEMLFVDNVDGLQVFLFEGYLQQAVACVFLILTVFYQPNEQVNEEELQLPVTSIRFRISCTQLLKRELVFAFYSFSKLKTSKWVHLDSRLRAQCLLMKQLPLSDCTYDNTKELQCGTAHSATSPACDGTSFEDLRRRRGKSDFHMVVQKDSSFVNTRFADEKHGRVPTFSLSFTAAPTFFIGLHLQLLLERSVSCVSLQGHSPNALQENQGKSNILMVDGCSLTDDSSSEGSEPSARKDLKNLSKSAACSKILDRPEAHMKTGSLSALSDGDYMKYSNTNTHVPGTSARPSGPVQSEISTFSRIQSGQCSDSASRCNISSCSSLATGHSCQHSTAPSCLNGLSVDIQSIKQGEKPVHTVAQSGQLSPDLCWSINDGVIRSPNPTAPRSMWHRSRSSSSSSLYGYQSHMWPDGKADLLRNGFGNGPKKPRTQVSYASPFGGHNINTRYQGLQHKGLSHKRIRRANEKRVDGSRSSERDMDLLSCDANVLVTAGDKGWREQGAQVTLELIDHNEWRLAVKVSGTTKYTHKAPEFLQPGTTNRYTHDMMWKGGKDWTLEFPDRSQWMLFKEMHEECYNRNFRAALKKNIPIPGVRLIEESDDSETEVPFVRICSKYYRQLETDVDMAMNPSRILYDMDSDDENWILSCNAADVTKSGFGEISADLFEKSMSLFEKVAYAQKREEFKSDELDELVADIGPVEVIQHIYGYWRLKRQKKGMPLLRQLQPPQWEKYQQQMNEWDLAMTKANTTFPNGGQEKAFPIEKPPMYAFCLKPRGLENPNKGSKHRSQKKISVSGQGSAWLSDHDGFHSYGRRLNGFASGDARYHEHFDALPLAHASPRVYSPRDAGCSGCYSISSGDGSERNLYPKFHRSRSRKMSAFFSDDFPQNQRTTGKGNAVHRLTMGVPEWPGQTHHLSGGTERHILEELDDSDLDEFRLRDASGAAQHAVNMAKLKKEKAQRLLYRADMAIHKAVVALTTAEAIKASRGESNGER